MDILAKRRHAGDRKVSIMLAGMILTLCLSMIPADCARAADETMLSMYRRAVDFPQGDLSRLANVLRKAQNGEEITIGFLGGSITEGRGAADIQDCYVSQVYKWWYDTFPQAAINVINAGVGGTSSYLGGHRVGDELLVHSPDLVFVEFAVNDTATQLCRNTYENLIRKILMSESDPALVLLFATNEAGDSSEEIEAALGRYYDLPMISYGKAVLPEIEAGSFAWYEIAEDIVHPNNRGHSIFAGLITAYLEEICSRLDSIEIDEGRLHRYELPEPLTPQSYQDAHIENASTLTPEAELGYGVYDFNYHFMDNWYALEEESYLSFEVEAENIGILYQRTEEGTFGQYDIYVDGVCVRTLDGNFVKYEGTETEAEELYVSPDGEKARHVITIVKNPLSVNTDFVIIGLLVG